MPGESGIAGIAADPSGTGMWFTQNDIGQVGSISLTGEVGESFFTGSYRSGSPRGRTGTCGTASDTATQSAA